MKRAPNARRPFSLNSTLRWDLTYVLLKMLDVSDCNVDVVKWVSYLGHGWHIMWARRLVCNTPTILLQWILPVKEIWNSDTHILCMWWWTGSHKQTIQFQSTFSDVNKRKGKKEREEMMYSTRIYQLAEWIETWTVHLRQSRGVFFPVLNSTDVKGWDLKGQRDDGDFSTRLHNSSWWRRQLHVRFYPFRGEAACRRKLHSPLSVSQWRKTFSLQTSACWHPTCKDPQRYNFKTYSQGRG